MMEYRAPRHPPGSNSTECRPGYQCKSTPGVILHLALVADGFPDCADASDETEEAAAAKDRYVSETLDGVPPELPELTDEQVTSMTHPLRFFFPPSSSSLT